MTDDVRSRLKGELRVTREKQARLRYQVRYLLEQHTRLRQAVVAALGELDAGRHGAAARHLEAALERASRDPDTHYTPPGAKRKAIKQKMVQKRTEEVQSEPSLPRITDEWLKQTAGDVIEAFGAQEDPAEVLRDALEAALSLDILRGPIANRRRHIP